MLHNFGLETKVTVRTVLLARRNGPESGDENWGNVKLEKKLK